MPNQTSVVESNEKSKETTQVWNPLSWVAHASLSAPKYGRQKSCCSIHLQGAPLTWFTE